MVELDGHVLPKSLVGMEALWDYHFFFGVQFMAYLEHPTTKIS